MEFTTTKEIEMQDDFTTAEGCWDSESRKSPFSTVADPDDEYCEDCEAASTTHCTECAAYLAAH